MSHVEFEVRSSWDGRPLEPHEQARVRARIDPASSILEMIVDATFYDDPKPPGPIGSFDGLWDFEVVEIFLLGENEEYLEIEFGPHGHFLALRLSGRRRPVATGIELAFQAERVGGSWHGEGQIALDWLPNRVSAANVYAMHGSADRRRYLASNAVPGEFPDFHRLEFFAPTTFD